MKRNNSIPKDHCYHFLTEGERIKLRCCKCAVVHLRRHESRCAETDRKQCEQIVPEWEKR